MNGLEAKVGAILAGVEGRFDKLPWILYQGWRTLGFLSWPLSPAALRSAVPGALELDTFDGDAWVTIVPMHMVGLHVRDLPPLPGENTFPETNVRTYVKHGDGRGVYFFGIEASAAFAAIVARLLFHVPYNVAEMTLGDDGAGAYTMKSKRGDAVFDATYRGVGDEFEAAPGSLEEFLTNRESSYAVDDEGEIWRGDVAHPTWKLRRGEVEIRANTLASVAGVPLPATAPIAHFSEGTDSLCYPFTVIP